MTELDQILFHHWQLLWPLPAAERIKVIDQLKADYEYEAELKLVHEEMAS